MLRLVFSAVLLVATHCFEPCKTPDGAPGDCVPIKQCNSLYSFFDNDAVSPRAATHLRRSQCGFSRRQPKVCCPTSGTTPGRNHLLPDPDMCGIHTSGKIVGGELTDLDEFPWMALLKFNTNGKSSFECGGTLINKRYVLTAAHCLVDPLIGVRLGEYNTATNPDCVATSFGRDCAPPPIDFGIEEKIVYYAYRPDDSKHDIGLIRLDRDVSYSDFIKPICLPLSSDEINKEYIGQNLTVSGWGLTEHEVKSTHKLKVQVPVRELSDCVSSYKKQIKVDLILESGQICAGGVRGQDSCKGDSGGPLMSFRIDRNKDAHFYAVGVVSFGPVPCGQYKLPGVYTKVAKYVNWIVSQLRP